MSDSKSHDGSMGEKSSDIQDNVKEVGSEIDLLDYHEHNAGRLVVDPEYARFSFRLWRSLNADVLRTGRLGLSLVKPSPRN